VSLLLPGREINVSHSGPGVFGVRLAEDEEPVPLGPAVFRLSIDGSVDEYDVDVWESSGPWVWYTKGGE
jgi:hypothetical protein